MDDLLKARYHQNLKQKGATMTTNPHVLGRTHDLGNLNGEPWDGELRGS